MNRNGDHKIVTEFTLYFYYWFATLCAYRISNLHCIDLCWADNKTESLSLGEFVDYKWTHEIMYGWSNNYKFCCDFKELIYWDYRILFLQSQQYPLLVRNIYRFSLFNCYCLMNIIMQQCVWILLQSYRQINSPSYTYTSNTRV